MKMMLIDDNCQLREGIRSGVDWENIGIDEIRTAENGREGAAIFADFLADIVLLDVMMPDMDGLDCLKTIKAIKENVKVLMISGYSEFKYAVEAMKYGAVGYELKPVKMQQLMTIVSKLVKEIQKENKDKELSQLHHKIYQEKVLVDILHGVMTDAAMIRNFIEHRFDIPKNSYLFLMCATVDDGNERITEEAFFLIEQILKSVLDEEPQTGFLLREKAYYYVYRICTASILEQMNSQAEMGRLLRKWNGAISEAGFSVSGGVSKARPLSKIAICFDECNYIVNLNRMAGKAGFRLFDDKKKEDNFQELYKKQSECLDLLLQDGQSDRQQGLKRIEAVFDLFREYGIFDKVLCHKITILTIERIRQYYAQPGYEENDLLRQLVFQQIDTLTSLAECLTFCKDYYLKLNQAYQGMHDESFGMAVQKARKYINRHYAETLSVEIVAEYINKSPNYLSHIFKKECGVSFSEYLNQVRISQAKELISNSDLMLYEIAEAVGYKSYVHFTQIFKKIEGYVPTQLRKNGIKDPDKQK